MTPLKDVSKVLDFIISRAARHGSVLMVRQGKIRLSGFSDLSNPMMAVRILRARQRGRTCGIAESQRGTKDLF
jgi:hypothetical protein